MSLRADRARLAVLLDLPRRCHSAHRGARIRACPRRAPAADHRAIRPGRRDLQAPAPRREPRRAPGPRGLRLARADDRAARKRRRLEPLPHALRRPGTAPRAAARQLRRGPHPRAGRPCRQLGCAHVLRGAAARRHLPHLLREHPDQRLRRRAPGGPAPDEPPARADRRLRSRGLDGPALLRRALPDHPQRGSPATGRGASDSRPPSRTSCGSSSSGRPSNERGYPFCCGPSRRSESRSRQA